MMINKVILTATLLIWVMASGCIKESLKECDEGNVSLSLFVEKFGIGSLRSNAEYEDLFADRIRHFHYFLYHNEQLVCEGEVNSFASASGPYCTLNFSKLSYGNYTIAIVANQTDNVFGGDPAKKENLLLTYPGCLDTDDYFTTVFSFEVQSNDPAEYPVVLLRAHGVVRYTFENVPDEFTGLEVLMTDLGSEKRITGDYENTCEVSRKYGFGSAHLQEQEENYMIGVFPTCADSRTTFILNVFRNQEETPFISQLVTDTLRVDRNRLMDIKVVFNNGNLDFEISLDKDWNGTLPGGETGLD